MWPIISLIVLQCARSNLHSIFATPCIQESIHRWRVHAVGETGRAEVRIAVVGSDEEADSFKELFVSFSQCASIFARKEPICDHLMADFSALASAYAHAYAEVWPKREPTLKCHSLTYHMPSQLRRLGSVGMFHEGIVEAAHVVDNNNKRRFACVVDPLENLRLRFQAYCAHADTNGVRLMAKNEEWAARKRQRLSSASRRVKHAM